MSMEANTIICGDALEGLATLLDIQEWELGYLAGMIDAECHIGIQREMSSRRVTPAYVIRFELAMTDRKPVDFVNRLLPSAKVLSVIGKGRRLPYYRLRLCQQEAITLLRTVLPYVQGKRRQIELCLQMDELRRRMTPSRIHTGKNRFQPLPPEFAVQADKIFAEFRSLQLNKKPKKVREGDIC